MTVQELINELLAIDDKSKLVIFDDGYEWLDIDIILDVSVAPVVLTCGKLNK